MRVRFRYVTYGGGPSVEQQDLERFFHEIWHVRQRTMLPAGEWRPPTDVYDLPDRLVVKMELAGVPEEAVEITLYADRLVVSGVRQDSLTAGDPEQAERQTISFYEAGIHYGPFRAEVRLPQAVDGERVAATLESGFLVISLPKAAA